jgi:hypothetical protein
MDKLYIFIANIILTLQDHPLLWQLPISAITTVGGFAWFRHKVAMEGRARITAWLGTISTLTVLLHLAITGIPIALSMHLLKLTAEQSAAYIGVLTVTYNLLKDRVTKFLTDAAAEAPDSPSTTPPVNVIASHPTADEGVVTI